MEERVQIETPDGRFAAYVATPEGAPRAAIVVGQEIFGINADMRQTCAELAAQGYVAICPDLFWRLEPGVELADGSEAGWQKALSLYEAFDIDAGVRDIAATLRYARTRSASGKVGVTGYCLGGLLTFLSAVRTGADAAVAYYGGGIERYVGEAGGLATPLLMHLGDRDEFIDAAARQRIIAALGGKPGVEIHVYPGCRHAFARHRGTHYDAPAAQLANARSAAFFRRHLG